MVDGMTGAADGFASGVWCLMDRAVVVLGDDGKVTGSPLQQIHWRESSAEQEHWIQLQGGARNRWHVHSGYLYT